MAISEAKRKSNAKWDKENMTTLGCKVKREQAEQFKQYAASKGTTANTTLKEYVLACIDGTGGNIDPCNAAGVGCATTREK